MELPVVNHPDYVAKINENSVFPIKKFSSLANYLLKEKYQQEMLTRKIYNPKSRIPQEARKVEVPGGGLLSPQDPPFVASGA